MSPAAVAAFVSYRNAEITTLNQRDLIVKLYAGAERFLDHAADALDDGDAAQAQIWAQKSRAIFTELLATLDNDKGGDIARQLGALYTFFITDITDALAAKDAIELRKLIPIAASLREAWEAIPNDIARTGGAGASGHSVDLRR